MMSLRSSIAMVVLMLVFVALSALTGCQKQADQKAEPAAGTKLVTVDITGMTGPKGGVARVRDALATLPWAKNVEVNFDRKQATFTAEIEQYDEAAIIAALKKEGFGGTVAK